MMPTVAILAGGLATRLRPLTVTVPKSLVEVAGRPFVSWQLDYLRDQGVREVVLCIGHLGEQIEAVVGDGHGWGLRVRYSSDGEARLGTGGALRHALPLLGETFFVLYGDSFLPIDFAAVLQAYRQSRVPALMTVLRNGNRWDRSNVHFEGGRLLDYDKHHPHPQMAYIDYGLGVLSNSVLANEPNGQPFDLADVYHGLARRGELAGFEVTERFYEIGSHEGLLETSRYFLSRETA